MNQKEMVEALAFFGLEEIDSKVYMGLLQTGPVSVGTLSAKLDIDRGKTYRALTRLRNMGVVTTTFSNPTLCSAISPTEAMNTILERKQDEITTMKNLSQKIVQDISIIARNNEVQELSSFVIIQGRSNIYSRISKLLQKASGVIYIVAPAEDLMRMYHTSIPERIHLLKEDGAQIRILTEVAKENELSFIDRLNPSEIRLGKLPSKSRMIVEENKQLIMSGALSASMDLNDEGDSVMHTNSAEMVSNMFSLCTLVEQIKASPSHDHSESQKSEGCMMGYKSIYCESLKQKDQTASLATDVQKRHVDLVNDLVDPICVISNASEILSKRLCKFVDDETRSYFEMISRAAAKTKTLVDELRNERILAE